jgi:hypothetical protein
VTGGAGHRSLAAPAYIALALWAGCGTTSAEAPRPVAAPPGQDSPPVPGWADQTQTLVDAGCKCPDEACLKRTRAALDALDASNGGRSEAPVEVHAAHRRFDICYREGTFDFARDVEHVTRALCGCADTGCVKRALAEAGRVKDKYKDVAAPEREAPPIIKLQADFDRCRAERIVEGAAWVPEVESLADTMCACADSTCVKSATLRMAVRQMGTLIVDVDEEARARMSRAYTRMCECALRTGVVGSSGAADCRVNVGGPPEAPEVNAHARVRFTR